MRNRSSHLTHITNTSHASHTHHTAQAKMVIMPLFAVALMIVIDKSNLLNLEDPWDEVR